MTTLRLMICVCSAVLVLTGCRFYPDRLYFKGGSAYPSWPIMFGTIEINGSKQPILGKGNVSTSMPPPVSGDVVLLTIPWVEYHSGASWQAELELPLTFWGRYQNAIDLEVAVGRSGAIEVFGIQPDESAPVLMLSACATRTPAADAGFEETIRYHASLDNWETPGNLIAPSPSTPCTNE